MPASRQLAILLFAFAAGTGLAALIGAAGFGIALGVGQLCFAATLVWLLLKA
ncbi:MAG TPA: hypothetical protein VEW07_08230 [Solirubrobacterales bacterium]|nr:hypothetical protein [Solirubrobacterales bacterium]